MLGGAKSEERTPPELCKMKRRTRASVDTQGFTRGQDPLLSSRLEYSAHTRATGVRAPLAES